MHIKRYLEKIAFLSGFGRQMRFVTGPRFLQPKIDPLLQPKTDPPYKNNNAQF